MVPGDDTDDGRPATEGGASSSSMPPGDGDAGAPPPPPPRLSPFEHSPFDEEGRQRIRAEVDRQRERLLDKQAEINKRSGRNLTFAIGIGVGLGVVVVASLLFVKQLFVLVGVAMVVLVVLELAGAMRASGRVVPRIPSAVVAALVVPTAYFLGPAGQWAALIAGIAAIAVWRLVRAAFERPRPRRSDVWRDFLAATFIQIYVTFLGSFTVMLVAQERGEFWVLGFILIVIAIDTGAYVVGLNFGKHKLAPRISPGKTWEGLGGAVVAAGIVAVVISFTLLQQPWWFGLIIAPLFVVTATAGDLTESMIKRDLGIKDISSWLPGHGGFFDRLDSILPSGAMAFALYFWTADLAPETLSILTP